MMQMPYAIIIFGFFIAGVLLVVSEIPLPDDTITVGIKQGFIVYKGQIYRIIPFQPPASQSWRTKPHD